MSDQQPKDNSPSNKPLRPKGDPLPRSERELERAADITEDDIQEAMQYFEEHAPLPYAKLLDAQGTPGDGNG